MKCFVYALRSLKDDGLYIDLSNNPAKRLEEHNGGLNRSTKSRRPFEIIYQKCCEDRGVARKEEIKLKSGAGREFLKSLCK